MTTERQLTLLHSNDIHGDFAGETVDSVDVGGISRLSAYVAAERAKNPNTVYCIAGDMLQGSLIDTEFKGVSTIEIMNAVNPDIVSLGNHEIDYGLGHLLFLERCAKFPIVCSNLFIRNPRTRLFTSHKILKINGIRVMFIGLVTREILATIRNDNLMSTLVDVEDAAKEVGRITSAYQKLDVDLTVLLTHIGHEEDKELAALLDPAWGIDLIIGGHSHTVLDHPAEVNGVVVSTAGHGTEHIGRFDLVFDPDENRLIRYEWRLQPIDAGTTPRDPQLDKIVEQYQHSVDQKYDAVVCRFPRVLTHPDRYRETELGNIISDTLRDSLGVDLMLVGSGSIRQPELGPLVTKGGLLALMPFEERIAAIKVTGAQLRRMIAHVVRDEVLDGAHGEFYQFSSGIAITYRRSDHSFVKFEFHGHELADDEVLRVGLQLFHLNNFEEFFAVPLDELPDGKGTIVATSQRDVVEEMLAQAHQPVAQVEGRLIIE